MWDREKHNIFGERIQIRSSHNSQTVFESGRESRRRIRKENRKRTKF